MGEARSLSGIMVSSKRFRKVALLWFVLASKQKKGKENWLLIKEPDEFARGSQDYNVSQANPSSLFTGRRDDEVHHVIDQQCMPSEKLPHFHTHTELI